MKLLAIAFFLLLLSATSAQPALATGVTTNEVAAANLLELMPVTIKPINPQPIFYWWIIGFDRVNDGWRLGAVNLADKQLTIGDFLLSPNEGAALIIHFWPKDVTGQTLVEPITGWSSSLNNRLTFKGQRRHQKQQDGN